MTETLDPRAQEQHRLIEEAAALEEFELSPGYQVWAHYAHEFLRAHQSMLAQGNISDIGEYRFVAGRVQGIQQVLDIGRLVAQARDQLLQPDERYDPDELEIADIPLRQETPDE